MMFSKIISKNVTDKVTKISKSIEKQNRMMYNIIT